MALRASCRATKASKQSRAGGKHVLPSLFYGKGGTKFSKLMTGLCGVAYEPLKRNLAVRHEV